MNRQMTTNCLFLKNPPSTKQLERGNSFSLPITEVELTVAARSLLNLDQLTHSDPLCVLFLLDSTTKGEWMELGRTEPIQNNLNPEWKTKFLVDYRFEERQLITFMVYDKDSKRKSSRESHDFLGKLECSLGEIVSASHSKFTRQLKLPSIHSTSNKKSLLIISSEEIQDFKQFINFTLTFDSQTNKTKGSKVFANVSKRIGDASWVLLHRTEVVTNVGNGKNGTTIRFPTIQIRYSSLCTKGNLETLLRIQIQRIKQSFRGKSSRLLGEVVTNFLEITEKCQNEESTAAFPIKTPPPSENHEDFNSKIIGTLKITNFQTKIQKTFMDCLQDGLEINFAVAIDFTSSNGEPTSCSSLHYKHGQRDNPYVMTLKIIGEILQDYTSSKKFYAYGFGAKGFPLANRVNHKFPLNFKEANPLCDGIEGILSSYYRTLQRVKLYGPTCFAPIIREVAEIAQKSWEREGTSPESRTNTDKYFVLVILTDGILCDPETTKSALIQASAVPMSVIIIGIGNEDFTSMEKLDSDDKLLRDSSTKRLAKRDIVQFVELKKFVNFKSITPITEPSKIALGRSVLAELPQQIVSWMNVHKTATNN